MAQGLLKSVEKVNSIVNSVQPTGPVGPMSQCLESGSGIASQTGLHEQFV